MSYIVWSVPADVVKQRLLNCWKQRDIILFNHIPPENLAMRARKAIFSFLRTSSINFDLITKTTFSGAFYGVTRNLIEKNDLFVIDPAGLRYLKEHYDGPKKIVAIAFSCPASVCKERMLRREDTEKEVRARLRHDKKAFKNFLKDCDYEIDATQSQGEILKQMKRIIETLNWWYEPNDKEN